MKVLIKACGIIFIGMLPIPRIMQAAALEEGWEQIEEKLSTDALFIQNDSYFDLVVNYYRINNDQPFSKTLFKASYIDIVNLNALTNMITIRIKKPFEQYGWYDIVGKIPGLTAISRLGGQLAKKIVPYYGTFESMVSYVTDIAHQTITINPRNYAPGTTLVFYWPLALASLNYPPIIIPLTNADAAIAWLTAQGVLNSALQMGAQGARTAYSILSSFVTGSRGLNSDQIGTIETIIKENLPAVQPQPMQEGIIEEYEQQPQ